MEKNLVSEKISFIIDPARRQFIIHGKDNVTLILKVAYNDSVDFLYTQYQYRSDNPLKIGDKLEYAGFVHHPSGRVYDGSYTLFRYQEEVDTISLDTLKNETRDAINAALSARVGMKPVPVTEAAEDVRDERKEHEEYQADREAREAFFARIHEITYTPHVALELSTEQTIQIVMHGDNFVTAWADEYILCKARHINERLWEIEVSQRRLDALWNTPGNHHTTLAIAGAIAGDMKTVNVYVDKEDKQVVVKMPGHVMRNADTTDYSSWHMDAPGRRAFENAFGRHASLHPSDIQRITYGKKVLYERKEEST